MPQGSLGAVTRVPGHTRPDGSFSMESADPQSGLIPVAVLLPHILMEHCYNLTLSTHLHPSTPNCCTPRQNQPPNTPGSLAPTMPLTCGTTGPWEQTQSQLLGCREEARAASAHSQVLQLKLKFIPDHCRNPRVNICGVRGRRRSLSGAHLRVKALGDQLAPAEPPGASDGGARSCSATPAPAAPHNSSPVPGAIALPLHNIPNCAGLNQPTQRPHSHPAQASSATERPSVPVPLWQHLGPVVQRLPSPAEPGNQPF